MTAPIPTPDHATPTRTAAQVHRHRYGQSDPAALMTVITDTRPGGQCLPAIRRAGAPEPPAIASEETNMVLRHHCVSIACDQCRAQPGGPGFTWHWPTETVALDVVAASGWYVADDGARVLCPACGLVLTCEAEGHEFPSWQVCGCGCRVTSRVCRRCGLDESGPALLAVRAVA